MFKFNCIINYSTDSDSSGLLGIDDWDRRKRHSIDELTEPLREELQEAFNQLGLEKDYFDGKKHVENIYLTVFF